MSTQPALVALDWGTTSLRAYLVARDGAVTNRIERPLGILNVPQGDFARAFRDCVGPWLAAHPGLPALASGMIGSRQGWREAAYVACPAGIDALAGALLEVDAGAEFRIVPGVSVVDGDGVPDVMRGEETQIFGLDAADGVAVLPGTHSKWVLVEGGRITRFATFMTGEAFAAMSGHTILGRLMTGTGHDEDGFARGVAHGGRDAAGRGGLLHRLFGARTLGLFERVPGHALHSYLSGLLIGAEIAEARAWLGRPPAEVAVIGAPALARSYAAALGAGGITARIAPADAAARGACAIARRAGLVA
ncbi:MAG: 2-dehydro-3-deoxygalactonokinase [Alphaproteobacteria bacterium]|nr:2-dehydro-3-deoxygalactonokinase [Alphaproteobacteria bacterium]